MPDPIAERVQTLIGPALAEAGVSLYDIEHAGGVLRVVVDRPGGVDLESISEVTRVVSRLLDEHDPVNGRYTLEVSSPGLERRLRTPAHYAGAIGAVVKIKLRPGADSDRRRAGTVVAADDHSVTVAIEPPDGGEPTHQRIALTDIEQARTVFEWGPSPRPGRAPAQARPPHSDREKKAAS